MSLSSRVELMPTIVKVADRNNTDLLFPSAGMNLSSFDFTSWILSLSPSRPSSSRWKECTRPNQLDSSFPFGGSGLPLDDPRFAQPLVAFSSSKALDIFAGTSLKT
jgi:hypothetical protein